MKTVLCFGDSNTHGHVPGLKPEPRFAPDVRWPGVMQAALGTGWRVIEEGLSGRTTIHDDPVDGAYKNGRRYLRACLETHRPLDLVIVMLGTNDLKRRFNVSAYDVASGVGALVDDIRAAAAGPGEGCPDILVIAPPPFCDVLPDYDKTFAGGIPKSRELAPEFRDMAEERGVGFFDAGTVCACDPIDGIHLGAEAHRALGTALAAEVARRS